MRTAPRLAAFGAGLLVVLGGSYAVGATVVPASVVEAWGERAPSAHGDEHGAGGSGDHGETAVGGLAAAASEMMFAAVPVKVNSTSASGESKACFSASAACVVSSSLP